jgi:hypothetical protein
MRIATTRPTLIRRVYVGGPAAYALDREGSARRVADRARDRVVRDGGPCASAGRCAGAWNATAPTQTRRFVVEHGVREATSTVAHVWTTSILLSRDGGSRTTRTTGGLSCALTFFVSPARSLSVAGTWRDGRVVAWSVHLVPSGGAAAGGNACVAADGSIHRVGRYTAASRCG